MHFEKEARREEARREGVRNQGRQLKKKKKITQSRQCRGCLRQMFTWTECVCVQHASLPGPLQLLYLHLAPGDVGDASLYVPELLMGRLYTLVQGPSNLHKNRICLSY